MRLAEHLAVVERRCAALRPGRDVVGVHFRELPDSRRVRREADCTERTVRNSLRFGRRRLLRIDRLCLARLEDAQVKKPRLAFTTENILEDAAPVSDALVRIDVVALVFRLNDELSAPPEKSLALQLVIHEPLANLPDRNLRQKRRLHLFLTPASSPRDRPRAFGSLLSGTEDQTVQMLAVGRIEAMPIASCYS